MFLIGQNDWWVGYMDRGIDLDREVTFMF